MIIITTQREVEVLFAVSVLLLFDEVNEAKEIESVCVVSDVKLS
jgi:hypothetical protein